MKFHFFDVEKIHRDTEAADIEIDGSMNIYDRTGFNYRWIQPPQIAYFVSSMDKYGNTNVTPVTMGTAMYSPPPYSGYYYNFMLFNDRHATSNLRIFPECVISYIPSTLLKESWISALPIPKGINEAEIAQLTPLPSKRVKPFGLKECPVNLEAKVTNQLRLAPGGTMFVCKIVGVSVNEDFLEQDKKSAEPTGVLLIDPLFEVLIASRGEEFPSRMYYGKINRDEMYRVPDDLGGEKKWLSSVTFDRWLEAERNRGRINDQERAELLQLNKKWQENRNPAENRDIKEKLTELLNEIVWRKIKPADQLVQ
jgi:flavin reductase (DIM6/NTAB) family NADH-FMN oxidoreductase RutF